MKPVFPYLVRRSEDGGRGELLLRLKGGKSAYIFHLSLEQARALAVEMRGLASNLCPQHHMTVTLAQSLGGTISHLVIRYVGSNNEVAGEIRMLTKNGFHSATVDPAAGLALAIHMGLPIFMDGDFALEDSTSEKRSGEQLPPSPSAVPKAFLDLIEGLDLPDSEFGSAG